MPRSFIIGTDWRDELKILELVSSKDLTDDEVYEFASENYFEQWTRRKRGELRRFLRKALKVTE